MNKRKAKRLYNFILVSVLILSSTILFNNKTIEKEVKNNDLKALEQEGETYRLVTSADNVQVPVPKGYVASQVTGENYVTPEYTHTTNTNGEDVKTKIHDGGFVIYQLTDSELEADPNGTSVVINDTNKDTAQSTRNQYVWVPIPNVEDIVRTRTSYTYTGIMQFGQNYNFRGSSIVKETDTDSEYYREPRLEEEEDITKRGLQKLSNINKREDYLNNMQEGFDRMIKSINKYKGFYIGRYETGDDYEHTFSKRCFINPKIVRYNANIGNVTWYESYKALERLSGKTGKYVETGMIYDSLWDYMIIWLQETDTRSNRELTMDSGTWGNFSNNTKTVTIGRINPARTGAIETITYKGITYSDNPTASNNIFDIAGNVLEWTRAKDYVGYRRMRGGYFVYNSAGFRACDAVPEYPNTVYDYYGVRGELLIK